MKKANPLFILFKLQFKLTEYDYRLRYATFAVVSSHCVYKIIACVLSGHFIYFLIWH